MTHFLLTVFDAPTTRDNYNKHIETQALLEREMRLQAGINSIATSAPLWGLIVNCCQCEELRDEHLSVLFVPQKNAKTGEPKWTIRPSEKSSSSQ